MKQQDTQKQRELLSRIEDFLGTMKSAASSDLYEKYDPKIIVEHLQFRYEGLGDAIDALKVSTEFDFGKLVDSYKRTNPLSSKPCNHVVTVEYRDGSRKSYSNVHYPEAYANKIIKERKSGADFWTRTWVAKIYIDQVEYTQEQHKRFTQTLI